MSSIDSASIQERREAGAFLRWLVLGLVIWALLITAFLAASVGGSPNASTSSSSRYIHFWLEKKNALLTYFHPSRLVIIGGSSSLYGIYSGALERDLQLPVINYGLHAGLGLEYLLYNARKHLRSGDVVLLLPEYETLSSLERYSWTLADYTFRFDPGFLLRHPGDSLRLATKLTPQEHWARFAGRWAGDDVSGQTFFEQLNGHGDLLSNDAESVSAQAHARTASYTTSSLWEYRVTPRARRELLAFGEWSRAHGVHVLGGFQPFYRFENLRADQPLPSELISLYEQAGIPVLGEPQAFLFERDRLFDSSNHLTTAGAEEMSQRLLPFLRKAIAGIPNLQREVPGASHLAADLEMSAPTPSLLVERTAGFSIAESWGRWMVGKHAFILMKAALPAQVTLHLDVLDVPPEKRGRPFKVRVGDAEQRFTVTAPNQSYELRFSCHSPCSRRIEIEAPDGPARKTAADKRDLSLALVRLRIAPTPE